MRSPGPAGLSCRDKLGIAHLDVFLEVDEVVRRPLPLDSLSRSNLVVAGIRDSLISLSDSVEVWRMSPQTRPGCSQVVAGPAGRFRSRRGVTSCQPR